MAITVWAAGDQVLASAINTNFAEAILAIPAYANDAGASDTYTATLAPAPTAYTTGMRVYLKTNTANTGACTLNLNALGAKNLKKYLNGSMVDPETGDLLAGMISEWVYDGTQFILQSPPATIRTRIKVGSFTLNNATGSQAITGVGFKPAAVLFFLGKSASSGADQASSFMVGAATSSSQEVVTESAVEDAAGAAGASTDTAASIKIRGNSSNNTVTEQADMTSLDSDGFTLNISTASASPSTVGYIAIA